MAEYQGYQIRQNSDDGKWEVYWKERKVAGDFKRQTDAEEWIDDQLPLYRTS